MEFGITILLIGFIGTAGALGFLALLLVVSLALCILLGAFILVLEATDSIGARLNEKPAQRAERLRMKEERRGRRRERLRHPLSF